MALNCRIMQLEHDGRVAASRLPDEAKQLLVDWKPGQPIPGGTFYHGLGSGKRKPCKKDVAAGVRAAGR
jgi:hypothetical protein